LIDKYIKVLSKLAQTMVGELTEDGKWMWDGANWVPNLMPTPISASNESTQKVVMQDSVISGDIIHNDTEAISSAVIAALDRIGLVKGITPTEQQKQELEAVDQLVQSHEDELSPEVYYELAESAMMSFDLDKVMEMLGKTHEAAIKTNDLLWENTARNSQLFCELIINGQGEWNEVYKLCNASLENTRNVGSKKHEAIALDLLANLHSDLGHETGLRESVSLTIQMIQILCEQENWEEAALSFASAIEDLVKLGDFRMAENYFNQTMELKQKHNLHPLVSLIAYSGKLQLIAATMGGVQAQIESQTITKLAFDAGFAAGLDELKINQILNLDDATTGTTDHQLYQDTDDDEINGEEVAYFLGGLFFLIFGLVDVIGSYSGFDLWGAMGIELPIIIWMLTGYIELGIAFILFNFVFGDDDE